jgi:hypothetical protein
MPNAQSKSDDEVRHNLEETVAQLSSDVLSLQQRAQDAETAQQGMVDEHVAAMHEMQQATAEGRKACTELADARDQAENAKAASESAQQVCRRVRACATDSFLDSKRMQRASRMVCHLACACADGAPVTQAVAKLSADNVVLIIKLRKAEERCASLGSERDELRAAVDTQSGPWFDDIQRAVQQRMEEGMQKAKELEAQLEQQQEGRARQLQGVREEKDQLAAHLSSTLTSCQRLEYELQQSQYDTSIRTGMQFRIDFFACTYAAACAVRASKPCGAGYVPIKSAPADQVGACSVAKDELLLACRKSLKSLRVELKQQQAALQHIQAARDEAQAAVRVVSEERQRMKEEWTEMFAAHEPLKLKISEQAQNLRSADEALQVRNLTCKCVDRLFEATWLMSAKCRCRLVSCKVHKLDECINVKQVYGETPWAEMQRANGDVARLEHQVSVEKAVTRDLMQRKSDTEYQLMEALAQLPIAASAPARTMHTSVPHQNAHNLRASTALTAHSASQHVRSSYSASLPSAAPAERRGSDHVDVQADEHVRTASPPWPRAYRSVTGAQQQSMLSSPVRTSAVGPNAPRASSETHPDRAVCAQIGAASPAASLSSPGTLPKPGTHAADARFSGIPQRLRVLADGCTDATHGQHMVHLEDGDKVQYAAQALQVAAEQQGRMSAACAPRDSAGLACASLDLGKRTFKRQDETLAGFTHAVNVSRSAQRYSSFTDHMQSEYGIDESLSSQGADSAVPLCARNLVGRQGGRVGCAADVEPEADKCWAAGASDCTEATTMMGAQWVDDRAESRCQAGSV